MRINSLSLENYRNIIRCDLTPGEGVNLIVGDNAQGKTNLMEAIWLLTGEKTFRYGREHDIPRLDMDRETQRTRVYANVFAEGRDQELEYILWPRRQVKINGITEPGRGAFSGKLCCVIFSPNHLSLVRDGPAERRDFLDGAISQLRPQYIKVLSDYNRALAQRSTLLREAFRDRGRLELLPVFDYHVARLGSLIQVTRQSYLTRLAEYAAGFHQGISAGKEELSVRYTIGGTGSGILNPEGSREELEQALLSLLEQGREEDLRLGSTGAGPHRDDLALRLSGRAARNFASQGQQRSIVLSLKLAECEMIADTMHSQPVVLLDDVMSELDRSRREYLLGGLTGRQVFITACDDSLLWETSDAEVVAVQNGEFYPGGFPVCEEEG